MAMSPLVIGAWSSPSPPKAAGPETSPAPAVTAPAAITPFLKNARRLLRLLNTLPSLFISFSFSRIKSNIFKRVPAHLQHGRKAFLSLLVRRRRWSEHSTADFTVESDADSRKQPRHPHSL